MKITHISLWPTKIMNTLNANAQITFFNQICIL